MYYRVEGLLLRNVGVDLWFLHVLLYMIRGGEPIETFKNLEGNFKLKYLIYSQ